MNDLLYRLHEELVQNAEPAYQKAQQWFFREGIDLIGVRVGTVRKIASRFQKEIRLLNKKDFIKIVNDLLENPIQEHIIVAFQWVKKRIAEFDETDILLFEKWLKAKVSNWASCDNFGTGFFGEYLIRYPEHREILQKWAVSKNRWLRRASAVSLIPGLLKKQFLDTTLQQSATLLTDKDDMVQKGYGWTLKVASKHFESEVFHFVMEHKAQMPRTALRYAIEKMPDQKKKQVMSR